MITNSWSRRRLGSPAQLSRCVICQMSLAHGCRALTFALARLSCSLMTPLQGTPMNNFINHTSSETRVKMNFCHWHYGCFLHPNSRDWFQNGWRKMGVAYIHHSGSTWSHNEQQPMSWILHTAVVVTHCICCDHQMYLLLRISIQSSVRVCQKRPMHTILEGLMMTFSEKKKLCLYINWCIVVCTMLCIAALDRI